MRSRQPEETTAFQSFHTHPRQKDGAGDLLAGCVLTRP